jgi:hypothetical protein
MTARIVERALKAYKHDRHNCAQSVLRAFHPHPNIQEEDILEARHHGGGRAEAGLCGALHAALRLIEEPSTRQRLRESFVAETGSEKCREIRRAGRVPCVECVRLATHLLASSGLSPETPGIPATESYTR